MDKQKRFEISGPLWINEYHGSELTLVPMVGDTDLIHWLDVVLPDGRFTLTVIAEALPPEATNE